MWVTASIESCAVVLHNDSSDRVLEGFVELTEPANDKIDEVVDVGIGLLLVIDGLHVLVCVLLTDSEQVVDGVVHDLHDLLRNEFFLSDSKSTSPSSIRKL